MVNKSHKLPLTHQCKLLEISRSSAYYRQVATPPAELELSLLVDQIHTGKPFLGSRGIRDCLLDFDQLVNRKRVQRLMRKLGITAIAPSPSLSKPATGHKVYPYLLRNVEVTQPNQVWCTDITYIPMPKGFLYLVAVLDWHSRKLLSWRLSNTMDADFCVEALEEALTNYGTPGIFNTDQGSQFTGEEFTGVLKRSGVKISMDGKGRWLDNVFIERVWRSLKYEEVYLKAYDTVAEAEEGIGKWIEYYNTQRRHQALKRKTPNDVYNEYLFPRGYQAA